MRKRRIGSLQVTVVGIGCNNFGRQLDAARTRDCVYAALDSGINFFDTADAYGKPKTNSETVLGEVIGTRRNEMVIATKFGRILDDRRRGAKAAYVRSATEDSLRRLKTDRIDLLQLHIPDPDTPIEETLGALADLIKEGKIREIGASNFDVTRLQEAGAAAHRLGIRGFASTQAEYNLLNRDVEGGLLGECERGGMALLPYFPLANGLLTGKYKAGEPPAAGSRIASKNEKRQAVLCSERNMEIVARLMPFSQQSGRSMVELAFGWLLSHAAVPSVIAGVSSPEQARANAAAGSVELTAAEVAELDRLAPRGPATPPDDE